MITPMISTAVNNARKAENRKVEQHFTKVIHETGATVWIGT